MILEPLNIKIDLLDGIYTLDFDGVSSEIGQEVWLCFNHESRDLYKYGTREDVLGFYSRCKDAFKKVGKSEEVDALGLGQWAGSVKALNEAVLANSLALSQSTDILPVGLSSEGAEVPLI